MERIQSAIAKARAARANQSAPQAAAVDETRRDPGVEAAWAALAPGASATGAPTPSPISDGCVKPSDPAPDSAPSWAA